MYSRSAKGGEKGDPNRIPWLAKMRTTWVIRIVNQRADNTMTKGKRTKRQTMIYKEQKTKDQAPQTPLKTRGVRQKDIQ
jgi:hypothetical protein